MTEKTLKICKCTDKIQEILNIIRPDCAWEIAYDKPERTYLTDWDRQYHKLIEGEDYFFIFEGTRLLYTVNVTGDSIITAIGELVDLLAKKF